MEKISHYQVIETIGQGAMGTVLRAFDTELERDVALKLMHPHLLNDPANEERFIREARAAAKLVHPNVVTIHEIGFAENSRFIVMEYADGTSLSDVIEKEGPLDWKRAVALEEQLLEGLSEAHSLGILHRDIKTDNILLTKQDQVKILDFGIAKFSSQAGMTAAGDILGTIEFMPPEQMLGEELDTRCDIYAAGVVLYHMLTGTLPFAAEAPVTLLYKKLNEDPLPPSFHNAKIHPELDMLVLKAIHRDREARWESATDFVQALRLLTHRKPDSSQPERGAAIPDFDLLEMEAVQEQELSQLRSVFVGRQPELKQIITIYQRVINRKGQTALIQGEAGVGKTTFASQFQKFLQKKNVWVLYGACLYQEGMDAFLPYIDALRGFFNAESRVLPKEERLRIKELVRERVPLLLEFTERFTTSFGKLNSESYVTKEGNQINLFEGIHQLISLLSEMRPLILVIDDLQWADEASLRLFHYLARNIGKHRILQIGISRTDRYDLLQDGKPSMVVEVMSRMRQEGICRELTLYRLSREESDRLVDQSLGRTLLSDKFYQQLFQETKGNPFFVLETLKLLKDKGDIHIREGVWYDRPDLKHIVIPNRIEDVFIRRLNALSHEEREVLQVAAVIGGKFDSSVLSIMLEMPKIRLLKMLQRVARDLQILNSTESGFQFEHPMLRDLLYNEIPSALRREYHLLAARQMEEIYNGSYGSLVGEVAEHWRNGENYRKAIPLLYEAGLRTFRMSACHEASIFFENLLESQAKSGESLPEKIKLTDIYLNLGICYEEIGRWQESVKTYQKLLVEGRKQKHAVRQIDALRRLGRVYIKLGENDDALRCYTTCLKMVKKHSVPNMLSRIYNNLGVIHFHKGEYQRAVKYFKQTLQTAEKDEGDYDVAHALTNIGIIFNIQGQFSRALAQYRQALKIYTAKQDRQSQAQVFLNMGITFSDKGDYDAAIEVYQKCFHLAEQVEDKGLLALTNLNLGKVYLRMENYQMAKNFASKALKFFKRVYDTISIAEVYVVYGIICQVKGEVDRAEKFFTESIQIYREKDYPEGLAEVYEILAKFYSQQGKPAEAEQNFRLAVEALRKMNLDKKADILEEKYLEVTKPVS